MRKTFLVFIFALLPNGLRATDITAPALDLGTVIYTGSNPGSTVFASRNLTAQNITVTGDGVNSPGPVQTAFNLANMSYGGAKNVYLQIVSTTYTINDRCGTVELEMSVQSNSFFKGPVTIKKTSGGKGLVGYANGVFFRFTATVTPEPGKGRCTISAPMTGWVLFAEGDRMPSSDSDYTPVDFPFTITLVTDGDNFEHDANASLNFGTIPASTSTRTFTVGANGSGSCTGSGCVVPGDIAADSFTFHSTSASSVTVGLPPNNTVQLSDGAGHHLSVNNFTSSCNGSCTMSGSDLTFSVGGTLTVPGGSSAGDYEGTYPVSVLY